MLPDPVLQQAGGEVLAARGDDDLFLAAGDREIAVRVEGPEVTGVQPAVTQRARRVLGVAQIAGEDRPAAQQDLAVVGEPYRGCGYGLSDGAERTRPGGLTVAAAVLSVRP
jgi:hypothetical protein